MDSKQFKAIVKKELSELAKLDVAQAKKALANFDILYSHVDDSYMGHADAADLMMVLA